MPSSSSSSSFSYDLLSHASSSPLPSATLTTLSSTLNVSGSRIHATGNENQEEDAAYNENEKFKNAGNAFAAYMNDEDSDGDSSSSRREMKLYSNKDQLFLAHALFGDDLRKRPEGTMRSSHEHNYEKVKKMRNLEDSDDEYSDGPADGINDDGSSDEHTLFIKGNPIYLHDPLYEAEKMEKQWLLQCIIDEDTLVDRFDCRQLLDDIRQIMYVGNSKSAVEREREELIREGVQSTQELEALYRERFKSFFCKHRIGLELNEEEGNVGESENRKEPVECSSNNDGDDITRDVRKRDGRGKGMKWDEEVETIDSNTDKENYNDEEDLGEEEGQKGSGKGKDGEREGGREGRDAEFEGKIESAKINENGGNEMPKIGLRNGIALAAETGPQGAVVFIDSTDRRRPESLVTKMPPGMKKTVSMESISSVSGNLPNASIPSASLSTTAGAERRLVEEAKSDAVQSKVFLHPDRQRLREQAEVESRLEKERERKKAEIDSIPFTPSIEIPASFEDLEDIKVPATLSDHRIIEKTALFVRERGQFICYPCSRAKIVFTCMREI